MPRSHLTTKSSGGFSSHVSSEPDPEVLLGISCFCSLNPSHNCRPHHVQVHILLLLHSSIKVPLRIRVTLSCGDQCLKVRVIPTLVSLHLPTGFLHRTHQSLAPVSSGISGEYGVIVTEGRSYWGHAPIGDVTAHLYPWHHIETAAVMSLKSPGANLNVFKVGLH